MNFSEIQRIRFAISLFIFVLITIFGFIPDTVTV